MFDAPDSRSAGICSAQNAEEAFEEAGELLVREMRAADVTL
jgi:hypothetical protein